jgi:hypothetical protein
MPAVRRTNPGLLGVAPDATEYIALLIAICASVSDVGLTVISAPNTAGMVIKKRNVIRNRVPILRFSTLSPLDRTYIWRIYYDLDI